VWCGATWRSIRDCVFAIAGGLRVGAIEEVAERRRRSIGGAPAALHAEQLSRSGAYAIGGGVERRIAIHLEQVNEADIGR